MQAMGSFDLSTSISSIDLNTRSKDRIKQNKTKRDMPPLYSYYNHNDLLSNQFMKNIPNYLKSTQPINFSGTSANATPLTLDTANLSSINQKSWCYFCMQPLPNQTGIFNFKNKSQPNCSFCMQQLSMLSCLLNF